MAVIPCPVCRKLFRPEDSPAMPFCSERCRQIDLGRWLGEGYSVPHLPSEDELEEAEAKEAAERRRDDDDQQEPTDDR